MIQILKSFARIFQSSKVLSVLRILPIGAGLCQIHMLFLKCLYVEHQALVAKQYDLKEITSNNSYQSRHF